MSCQFCPGPECRQAAINMDLELYRPGTKGSVHAYRRRLALRCNFRRNIEYAGTAGALQKYEDLVVADGDVRLALKHTKRCYILTFNSYYHGTGLATKVLSRLNGTCSTYLEGLGGGVVIAPYPFSEELPAVK